MVSFWGENVLGFCPETLFVPGRKEGKTVFRELTDNRAYFRLKWRLLCLFFFLKYLLQLEQLFF